ncbi:XrtA/PEP-CTERM system histidine kinase PrsK [Sphingomonas jatrophae]|uniref:histidine kinase n=1 Tax=Sphingomonas jatrophae TaxID=1166337 RepID=A0A1I6LB05_9SPHN|nr:XrtA/PEP-CTERM system histidine kinase PrsK [Sphingomonas jatrophae]SFS00666.1 putative PEP-CTERM system histidine kinase [Sphingomonas jatrophae]
MSGAARWSPSLVEARGQRPGRVRLSRHALLQSLVLLAFAGSLVAMILLGSWLPRLPDDVLRTVAVSIVCAISAAVIALLPSSRTRALAKVMLAKHLFAHRYDYREEWLRFVAALGRTGADAAPLGTRVAQAIADIVGSPAALLLVAREEGELRIATEWRWPDALAAGAGLPLADHLRATGRVLAFDRLRAGEWPEEYVLVPEWMLAEEALWAGVPLLHGDRLEGLLLLHRPVIDRALDWEDFDLLRLAGQQAAGHLAEARVQEALAEARRFDEFNRRFAFIMHDVKNLVSQLALLARNAERHADNPAFRADMIETLNGSATRLNDMLARLDQHHRPRAEERRAFSLGRAACAAALAKRAQHPIEVAADPCLGALGDVRRLEQALEHLIQNAIEASPAGVPVIVATERRGDAAAVIIADRGCGMDAEFVAHRLFRPFASTKPAGFGIGAYEVRALIRAMGGRLEVESAPGRGTRFTVLLPSAELDGEARQPALAAAR